jgi:hypothetical protein
MNFFWTEQKVNHFRVSLNQKFALEQGGGIKENLYSCIRDRVTKTRILIVKGTLTAYRLNLTSLLLQILHQIKIKMSFIEFFHNKLIALATAKSFSPRPSMFQ